LGGLLARLGLVRVVARFALGQTSGIEETQHAVGWLGTNLEPMLGALGIQHDAVIGVLGQLRVEGAELFDEAAIAGRTGVSNDDVIEWALLGATTGETELEGHFGILELSLVERLFLLAQ